MNEEQLWLEQIQLIREQLTGWQKLTVEILTQPASVSKKLLNLQLTETYEAIAATLDQLQVLQEEAQANAETTLTQQDHLLEQNQQLILENQYYYDLFFEAPDGYLLTDAQGVILEANRMAAMLLNVPQPFLSGKPLAIFISQPERQAFRCQLAELHQHDSVQQWEVCIQPREGELLDVTLRVAPVRNQDGLLVGLRICLHQVAVASATSSSMPLATTPPVNVPALDGLQVLFVDDEADARELIAALLQQQGIAVTAVATVAEAMQELERSRPDVLISDIRMPDEDGYALIQKIRALEAEKGWQIPAAALTAYLAEDRAAVMAAGFESHLHKLAQPTELIAMVAQLAGRG